MSKTNYYTQKKEYIGKINETFAPLVDFGGVAYAHLYNTENEYLKYMDSVGGAKFVDVTGKDLEAILLDVMAIVVGSEPSGLITETKDKRRVASLF